MASRILLVDDTPTARYAYEVMLQREGYDVISASGGRQALRLLRDHRSQVDLVISDLRMPEMSGTELVETMRGHEQLKLLPFLMLTRSEDEQDLLDALEAGASDFLSKSCKKAELFARVKTLLTMKHLQDYLKHSSETDSLTGLSNRRHGNTCLEREITRARRYQRPLSVALVDIDHFKRVNDVFGHKRGDDVLTAVADELRAVSRDSDVIVRWGGEEFLFVFPETTASEAACIVERLRAHLAEEPLQNIDEAMRVTISGGVSELEENDTLDSLVDRADKGLYGAKNTGRNRLLRWSEGVFIDVLPSAN